MGQSVIPLNFEALTINNGLSQGFVSSVTQDKKGFMWFGTSDGLNRYDGYSFTVFHHEPLDPTSLGEDDIASVFEDSQERLWICTRNNGIDLFDRQNLQFIHIKYNGANGLSSNKTFNIAEDKTGALWVRTAKGIDRMEIKEKNTIGVKKSFFFNSYVAVYPY